MLCKMWGFHCGDYEECSLLGYKNPVRTSHETHYFTPIEPTRLMLCNIRSFPSGDCEGRRLLWYNTPFHTSHETHYVSASKPVFTAVTMKNAVMLDVTPRGSCKNRSFVGTWRLYHQGGKIQCSRNNFSNKSQPTEVGKKYYLRQTV
jgi:hypothetical protein